jgi:hypothetical protein
MATTNLARFTINGTPSEDTTGKRGYDAGAGEVLAITLEANPALGVLTIKYDVHDSANLASPVNSLYDSVLTFTENGEESYITSSINTTVHITVPAGADISSYLIRATAATATGAHIFERLICVRKNGLRMTVPAESLQYSQRGWSDALNELTKMMADGAVSVSVVSSTATGTVAAFPAGQRRIFHSDGTTNGGVWTALNALDLLSAVSDNSLPVAKLIAGTEGYYLRTVLGFPFWTNVLDGSQISTNSVSPAALTGGTANTVLTKNGSNVATWATIVDANVSASAAIDVTKLALSAAMRSVLTSSSSSNAWTANVAVDSCSAMLYLQTNGYLYLSQAATEPPNPAAWGTIVYSDVSVLKSKFNNGTIWEIASQAS